METKKKIKEIYNCKCITSSEELFPLQKWYNNLIDKTIDEITIADVLRMIRQKEFIDVAMSKAIEFLKENIFAGEGYDGELLEKLSKTEISFLKSCSEDLKLILANALKKNVSHEWSYDGEENEFKEIVELMLKKLG